MKIGATFWKKQYHVKVLFNSFHLNRHTLSWAFTHKLTKITIIVYNVINCTASKSNDTICVLRCKARTAEISNFLFSPKLLEPIRKKFQTPELQKLTKLAYPEPKKASKCIVHRHFKMSGILVGMCVELIQTILTVYVVTASFPPTHHFDWSN